jgi:hypothetical protein
MKRSPTEPIVIVLPDWVRAPLDLSKELHVLLPMATGGLLAMLLSLVMDQSMRLFFIAPYALTCCAVGAMAFGHDFSHGTLGAILALPISRQRLWWNRMKPAAIVVLGLAAAAFLIGCVAIMGNTWENGYWRRYVLPPIFGGLCLAPWLTLTSRSAMFGTIISAAIPSFVWAIGDAIARKFGVESSGEAGDQFSMYVMPILWIAGAVLGWRRFMTLEVIEGAGGARFGKARNSRAGQQFRRSSPTWQLLKKEVMVQRFPIGLSILCMAIVFLLTREQTPLWTMVYPPILIVIVGSVASAEERQIGTVEWQIVLPVAYWKQWSIKFFATWGIALMFGFVLPLWVWSLKTGELGREAGPDLMEIATVFAGASFGIVVISLYVSSLCNTGLKAVMASVVVNVFAAYVMIQAFEGYTSFLWKNGDVTEQDEFLFHNGDRARSLESTEWWLHREYSPLLISLFAGITLALIFAARNHRYVEQGAYRVLRQIAAFAGIQALVVFSAYIFWNCYTWLR